MSVAGNPSTPPDPPPLENKLADDRGPLKPQESQNKVIKLPGAKKRIDTRIVDKVCSAAKELLDKQQDLCKADLPALYTFEKLFEIFPSTAAVKDPFLKKVTPIKLQIQKTIQALESTTPFPVFPDAIMEEVAAFLPRSDIRTLENMSESVENPSTRLSARAVQESVERMTSEEIENFVAEVVEDHQSGLSIFAKTHQFFKHASADQQTAFFSTFLHTDAHDECLMHILHSLPAMNGLKILDLSACEDPPGDLVESILTSPRMNHLQIVKLTNCNLTDEGVAAIARMPNLQVLDLAHCYLSEEMVEEIANSPFLVNLQQFILSHTEIDDEDIAHIARSPHMIHLQHLDLSLCKGITRNGINEIANSPYLSNLNILNLSYCDSIEEGSISLLAQSEHMTNLQVLNLQFCLNVTDEDIEALIDGFHMLHLRDLNLGNCTKLTERCGQTFANASQSTQLETLNLRGCQWVDEDIVEAIISNPALSHLKEIGLQRCNHISAEGVERIAAKHPAVSLS